MSTTSEMMSPNWSLKKSPAGTSLIVNARAQVRQRGF